MDACIAHIGHHKVEWVEEISLATAAYATGDVIGGRIDMLQMSYKDESWVLESIEAYQQADTLQTLDIMVHIYDSEPTDILDGVAFVPYSNVVHQHNESLTSFSKISESASTPMLSKSEAINIRKFINTDTAGNNYAYIEAKNNPTFVSDSKLYIRFKGWRNQ